MFEATPLAKLEENRVKLKGSLWFKFKCNRPHAVLSSDFLDKKSLKDRENN